MVSDSSFLRQFRNGLIERSKQEAVSLMWYCSQKRSMAREGLWEKGGLVHRVLDPMSWAADALTVTLDAKLEKLEQAVQDTGSLRSS